MLFPVSKIEGGSIKELFPTGKQLEPLVAPLADGKVAVGQDDLTVVLNEEGAFAQKCALKWTDIPIAMGKTDMLTRDDQFYTKFSVSVPRNISSTKMSDLLPKIKLAFGS